MAVRYYPALSDIVALEDLPEALSFAEDGLSTLLDDLYFRDLRHTRNANGDAAFYAITLIAYSELGIDIPGTGISLVLNPDPDGIGLTEVPVTLHYSWKILGLLKDFDLQNFSFDNRAFFDALIRVLKLTGPEFAQQIIVEFVDDPDPVNEFLSAINAHYSVNIPDPVNPDPLEALGEIASSVELTLGINLLQACYETFIESGGLQETATKLEQAFSKWFRESALDFIKDLLIPKINASLELGVGLRFPRNILTPLDGVGGNPIEDENVRSMLVFTPGPFTFSSEAGIGYDQDLVVELNHPSAIGNTGLEISIEEARLDISRTSNIPEADADGRPADFVGVYIARAEIGLPQFWVQDPENSTAIIVGTDLIIGTGGFSGTIGLEAKTAGDPAPLLESRMGNTYGFSISLDSFSLTFQQNSITGSEISGNLTLPGLNREGSDEPAEIAIEVLVGEGDFAVTASLEEPLVAELPGILKIGLKSVFLGENDDQFFLGVSGHLELIAEVPVIGRILPEKLDIDKLIIYEDGSIEFEGGSITLPDALDVKIGPVELSITAIHYGSHEQFQDGHERKYKYFGLDGGVGLDPGGVAVRGNGIKFYYTVDDDPEAGKDRHTFLRIEGIGIDMVIPGTATPETAALLLSGYLSMKNPEANPPGEDAGTEYAGGVSFSLPKVGMAGSAGMRLNPDQGSFIVDAGLELSTPIPLGATGLGIYGFSGLFGMKYVATKEAAGLRDEEPWYQYYKAKVPQEYKEGVQLGKFSGPEDRPAGEGGVSIGAGISLATTPDSGRTFSSKLFFLLSLPEVFLLEGQAGVLRERVGLDTTQDPPFYFFLSISPESVEAAFGVRYKLPDPGGEVLDLNALIEMGFFFKNANAWYINLGRDQPEEKRVSARVLSLFDAHAYLMLSASGFKTGAGASWDFNKKYGPVSVGLGAYLNTGAELSFKPFQLGGFIELGGYAYLRVFGFGFNFDFTAGLAGEAPKQFIVTGYFRLKIPLPWPVPDIKLKVELTWVFDDTLNDEEILFLDTSQLSLKPPVIARNLLTSEQFPVLYRDSVLLEDADGPDPALPDPELWPGNFDDYVIPLDSRLDIEFAKHVKPFTDRFELDSGAGYVWHEMAPPVKAKSEQVRHTYAVENIELKCWRPGLGWASFDLYDANTPQQDLEVADFQAFNQAPFGKWQLNAPEKYNQLSILARTGLEYMSRGLPFGSAIEYFGIEGGDLLCAGEQIEKTCENWEEKPMPRLYEQDALYHEGQLSFRFKNQPAELAALPNHYGFEQSVFLRDQGVMELYFPDPVACVDLKLTSNTTTVFVHWYKRERVIPDRGNPTGGIKYVLIKSKVFKASDLFVPVGYDDPDNPVAKVVIEPTPCDVNQEEKYSLSAWLSQFCSYAANLLEQLSKACNEATQKAEALKEQYLEDLQKGKAQTIGYRKLAEAMATAREACLQFRRLIIFRNCLCGTNTGNNSINTGTGTHNRGLIGSTTGTPSLPKVLEPEDFLKPFLQLSPSHYRDIIRSYEKSHVAGLWSLDPDCEKLMSYIQRNLKSTKCFTLVHEVCWLTRNDWEFNQTIPDQTQLDSHWQDMVEGMNKIIQPVWRPDTQYALRIKTQNALHFASEAEPFKTYTRYFDFGFRTAGPLGHFHIFRDLDGAEQTRRDYQALQAKDQEDQYKLSRLLHYIDLETSWPNADGALVPAKPLFYENVRLRLHFSEPYAYTMLYSWDAYNGLPEVPVELEALIRDPASAPHDPAPDSPTTTWVIDNTVHTPAEVEVLNNFLDGEHNCTLESGPVNGFNMHAELTAGQLKPLKLYTAIFKVNYKADSREVHRYNFQTSRYADFRAQMLSFDLDPENGLTAVYPLEIDLDDYTKAFDVLNLTSTPAEQGKFADRFDRLINGALEIPALEAPVTTEFNLITNSQDGNLIGILARSPEPFLNPRMPESELPGSLTTKNTLASNGSIQQYTQHIWSKDRAQVFITNGAMDLPAGMLKLRFKFKTFENGTWAIADAMTDNILIHFDIA